MRYMYQPQPASFELKHKRPRIVGSLSTLPSRLFCCVHAIKSILSQNMSLDALYLNLPYVTLKGKSYTISPELQEIADHDPRFRINRCRADYGPITKLLPILDIETDSETRIITFDDDVLVHPDVVEILMNKSLADPNACFSFSGWCVGTFPFAYQRVINAKIDEKCDWIQGVNCIIYRRSMLDMDGLLKFRRSCPSEIARTLWMNDDHWLSGYLADKGIERIAIGQPTTKFFIDLETVAHKQDSISRRTSFYEEVYNVSEYFRKRGYYGRFYKAEMSVLFPSICMGPIFLLGVFSCRPFVKAIPELVILNILICCMCYKLIRMVTVEPYRSLARPINERPCAPFKPGF
jgi:hypothetical protein